MIVIIIDSHPVFLNGLTQFLYQLHPGAKVLRYPTISAFTAASEQVLPDIIILGVNRLWKPGEVKLFEAASRPLSMKGIILFYDEVHMVVPFLKTGASGFIGKKGEPQELADCLESILKGKRYLSNELLEWMIRPTK